MAVDHRIESVVVSEGDLFDVPVAGLGVGVEAGVGEVHLGDAAQVFVLEPVAAVVLVGDVGEQPGPEVVAVEGVLAGPARAAQQLGRPQAADVAEDLRAGHEGHVVAAGLYLGRGGQRGQASRRAGRLVAGCGQAHEGGVDADQQTPELGLEGGQLAGQVADVGHLDVGRLQIGVGQGAPRGRLQQREEAALRCPLSEVGLPAAKDVHRFGHRGSRLPVDLVKLYAWNGARASRPHVCVASRLRCGFRGVDEAGGDQLLELVAAVAEPLSEHLGRVLARSGRR